MAKDLTEGGSDRKWTHLTRAEYSHRASYTDEAFQMGDVKAVMGEGPNGERLVAIYGKEVMDATSARELARWLTNRFG